MQTSDENLKRAASLLSEALLSEVRENDVLDALKALWHISSNETKKAVHDDFAAFLVGEETLDIPSVAFGEFFDRAGSFRSYFEMEKEERGERKPSSMDYALFGIYSLGIYPGYFSSTLEEERAKGSGLASTLLAFKEFEANEPD